MGLIGAWLGSLYHAMPLLLMPPQAFLGRPSRWLHAMSEQRATLTGAPNFAYEILATRVPDADLQGLDLRAWRAAVNGSEPVHAATLAQFAERFGRVGFDRRAMMPVYGLAECGVGLAFPPLGRGPRVDLIDRRALQERGRAEPAGAGRSGTMEVVCCGLALPGHELRIVDEHGAEQPDRHEGRIEFRGPSTTAGYFRNPQATQALFHGDWLDSGDVGSSSMARSTPPAGSGPDHPRRPQHPPLRSGAGRRRAAGIRRGCGVWRRRPHSRSERVVVLAERPPSRRSGGPCASASPSARSRCSPPPDDISWRCRTRCRRPPAARSAARPAAARTSRAVWGRGRGIARQLAALWLDALRRRWREPWRGLAFVAFGAWLWVVLAAGAVAGCAVALWPARAPRKRAARAIARAAVWASGLPAAIDDGAALPAGPWIAVANHASYVDWLLLTAALQHRPALSPSASWSAWRAALAAGARRRASSSARRCTPVSRREAAGAGGAGRRVPGLLSRGQPLKRDLRHSTWGLSSRRPKPSGVVRRLRGTRSGCATGPAVAAAARSPCRPGPLRAGSVWSALQPARPGTRAGGAGAASPCWTAGAAASAHPGGSAARCCWWPARRCASRWR
jgi:hypothetical protein